MIRHKKKTIIADNKYRLSVLDTLLNRSISEMEENEAVSDETVLYSDSDKNSHRVSLPSSQILSENSVTNTTIDSPLYHETKTPTTRSQQLPILLARNYYTAPACLLRFVNTSSSIRSYESNKRDSDGTVIDNEFEPLVDYNVDTNDEMDSFKLDDDDPETFSIGTMTNRTSFISDQYPESTDFQYMSVDPVDLNLVLQSVTSNCNQHFDKGCSPLPSLNERKSILNNKVTVDKATSPLFIDESELLTKWTSKSQFKSNMDLKPQSTELDSYRPDGSKNLNTTDMDVEIDYSSSEFPLDKDFTTSTTSITDTNTTTNTNITKTNTSTTSRNTTVNTTSNISNKSNTKITTTDVLVNQKHYYDKRDQGSQQHNLEDQYKNQHKSQYGNYYEDQSENHHIGYTTLESGDFSLRSKLSPNKECPVYSRSNVYRLRVPLCKRLKNVDEQMLSQVMSSPLLSTTRVNLSCSRIYTHTSKGTNSVDSVRSFLRLSDLDSNSKESSKHSSQSFRDKNNDKRRSSTKLHKKHKRYTNLPDSDKTSEPTVTKRSKHLKSRF